MYKIVVDSCGELPEELKKDGHFETVSLELEVDGYRIKDDETFNQLDFLRRVKKSITGPKSSCRHRSSICRRMRERQSMYMW